MPYLFEYLLWTTLGNTSTNMPPYSVRDWLLSPPVAWPGRHVMFGAIHSVNSSGRYTCAFRARIHVLLNNSRPLYRLTLPGRLDQWYWQLIMFYISSQCKSERNIAKGEIVWAWWLCAKFKDKIYIIKIIDTKSVHTRIAIPW